MTNNYRSDNLRVMFSKVLKLTSDTQHSLKAGMGRKRKARSKENNVLQDVKKALMSADQNLIVMVRG